jgi:hypothetical protein
MAANPFRFGAPVADTALIGRETERAEVVRVIKDVRNLALVAPRGAGKTSLLLAALRDCRAAGIDTAYTDLAPAINTRRFAEIYASALTLEPTSTVEAMQKAISDLVPAFVPRVTISGSGRPGLQLDLWDRDRDLRALLERILDAPAQLRQSRGRPLVVVLDDFEDLVAVAEPELLKALAVAIRRHLAVSYVFALRKDETVRQLFHGQSALFHKLADPVRLSVVPPATMAQGIERLFHAGGVSASRALIDQLLVTADQVPHHVQMLAHALFEEGRERGAAGDAELKVALAHVLEAQAYAFRFQWDQLSPFQRNLVLAIAGGHTERLHSLRSVTRLGLGSPSTVSKNLRTLMAREVLRKDDGSELRFVDPFFGLWLQRRMM